MTARGRSVGRRRAPVVASLVAASLVAASVVLAACGGSSSAGTPSTGGGSDDFAGYVRRPVRSVRGVSLPSADGTTVAMPAVPGGLRLVHFGYTSCPDVCPTTMADIARAVRSLPAADRGRVQVAMVSIDPARDSAAKLAGYVSTFVPDGEALRTDDDAALRAAARAFGADYEVRPGADGQPEVSHTSDVFVVDDTGEIVLAWPFGTSSRSIAADIRRLLSGERPPGLDAATRATTSTTATSPTATTVAAGGSG